MFTQRRDNLSCRAMTLLEMILAISIVSVIFAALLPQFRVILNSWATREGTAESLQNARVLIDHINRNLSTAVRITAVSDSSETDGYIQFEDNDGDDLRYEIAGGYVQFGEVGALSDLAGPVSQLQFTCYDACDLDTSITDVNSIRFVNVQTILTNSAALGQEKTLTTSAYLRTNWNSSSEPNLVGLLGWWKLDETSGLIAADSSGNGNDGTLGDMVGNEWTTGRVGGALAFDGDDDHHIDGIGKCPKGNYTVAGWAIDTGSDYDWMTLYSAEQHIWFGVDSEASAAVWLDCGGSGKGALTTAGTWTQDAWHHIAATWDGSNIHIYIDGADMSITVYGSPKNPKAKNGVIGAFSTGTSNDNWYGILDDVRLYDRALTADEISALASGSGGGGGEMSP